MFELTPKGQILEAGEPRLIAYFPFQSWFIGLAKLTFFDFSKNRPWFDFLLHFNWRGRDFMSIVSSGNVLKKLQRLKKTLWRGQFSTLVKQEGVQEPKISEKSMK